jgi:hypothetical protein
MQIIVLVLSFLLLSNANTDFSTKQLSESEDNVLSEDAELKNDIFSNDEDLENISLPDPFSDEYIEKHNLGFIMQRIKCLDWIIKCSEGHKPIQEIFDCAESGDYCDY